ncbi:hypothetical protein ABK040_014509 [Willaertia magna]
MQVSVRDGRFYQPLFKYPQINRAIVGTLDDTSNQLQFNIDFISNLKIKDLTNLNQIVSITSGYSQLVIIYENYKTNKLTGVIIDNNYNCHYTLELPKEFTKKEDIGFFYFSSDYNKEVYFLQLKSTKQVFVKGNNNDYILGIFNDNNDKNKLYKDWIEITDKRLQKIKDIKTNTFTTLFFLEDNTIYICGRDTNGELLNLTNSLQNEEIVKIDLFVNGTIMLTKKGELFSMSQDEHCIFSSFLNSQKLIKIQNSKFLQLNIKYKILDLFSIDSKMIIVNKEDKQLFLVKSNEITETKLYYNEIKTLFCSYNEFYMETIKNEFFIINNNVTKYCGLENENYKKLANPMVRNILNFKSENLVFFEEEDLIKRNFYYSLQECKGYRDLDIYIVD